MRRTVLVPVLALLAAVLLGGCAVTADTFTAHSASRTLTVWTYLAGDEEDANFAKLDALYAREHPDVRIRRVVIPLPQFPPKLLAAAATGDGPDVIIGNPVVDFPLLSRAKVYADLGPYWQGYADRSAFSDAGLWRDDRGRLDAVQWRFGDLGLWYNKDILDRAHVPVPHTIGDFQRALAALHAAGQQPLALGGDPSVQSAWTSMVWLYTQGVNYCTLGGPKTDAAVGLLANWVRAGYLPIDTAGLGIEDAFDRFLSGKVAFTIGGSWELGKMLQEPPDFAYGSAAIPAGAAGQRNAFAGESIGIGAYAKDKDLAWDYLKTSYLSVPAELTTFRSTAYLPPRLDVRHGPEVSGNVVARPFVSGLDQQVLQPWPDNPNTLDAQTDVGSAFSAMFSGDVSGPATAAQLRTDVSRAFRDGGGGC